MDDKVSPEQKRESVRENYDKIAKQYSEEFGNYIEDLDVYEEFEKYLPYNASILDLGAGAGRTYAYFSKKGYQYIGLDFSQNMKDYAYETHGEFPYIVDDMVNIKKHFSDNSIDSVFAVYSLFHLPKEDFLKTLSDIHDILKTNGVLLFSYQLGNGEEFADEPYLGQSGKDVLYMNYQTKEEVEKISESLHFEELYTKEKTETLDSAINSDNNTTVFKIVKKV